MLIVSRVGGDSDSRWSVFYLSEAAFLLGLRLFLEHSSFQESGPEISC